MLGEPLEVEYLRPDFVERAQETALAGAGQPADDYEAKLRGKIREACHHVAAIGLVSAFELYRTPADFLQHVRERAAALAATPAVHERRPFSRLVAAVGLEDSRDVARDQRRPEALGGEARDLRVHRADFRALCVVE